LNPPCAHCGGDDLEVRVCGGGLLDHCSERVNIQRREVFVHTLNLETEARGEVLLVSDHHIDESGDLAVDLLRLGPTTDGLPQTGAVVEVVGDNGAVLLGRSHGVDGNLGGGLA
jgi:hypothetical protein